MATTNIVSLITQFITPDMVARASTALGIDRATLQKALGAGDHAVLEPTRQAVLERPRAPGAVADRGILPEGADLVDQRQAVAAIARSA